MDLDTDSKWLNTVWPQLSHLQNGTINFASERQGSRGQEISKSGFIIICGSWEMSCPLSGQLNNLLLFSLLEHSYSGHAQKLEI